MLPRMGKLKDMKVDEHRKKHTEAIVLSMTMTARERARPEIMNGSRRKRVADGAGRSGLKVNQLLKQFTMMQKMMKNIGMMRGLMGQMSCGGKGGMHKGFGF